MFRETPREGPFLSVHYKRRLPGSPEYLFTCRLGPTPVYKVQTTLDSLPTHVGPSLLSKGHDRPIPVDRKVNVPSWSPPPTTFLLRPSTSVYDSNRAPSNELSQ